MKNEAKELKVVKEALVNRIVAKDSKISVEEIETKLSTIKTMDELEKFIEKSGDKNLQESLKDLSSVFSKIISNDSADEPLTDEKIKELEKEPDAEEEVSIGMDIVDKVFMDSNKIQMNYMTDNKGQQRGQTFSSDEKNRIRFYMKIHNQKRNVPLLGEEYKKTIINSLDNNLSSQKFLTAMTMLREVSYDPKFEKIRVGEEILNHNENMIDDIMTKMDNLTPVDYRHLQTVLSLMLKLKTHDEYTYKVTLKMKLKYGKDFDWAMEKINNNNLDNIVQDTINSYEEKMANGEYNKKTGIIEAYKALLDLGKELTEKETALFFYRLVDSNNGKVDLWEKKQLDQLDKEYNLDITRTMLNNPLTREKNGTKGRGADKAAGKSKSLSLQNKQTKTQ